MVREVTPGIIFFFKLFFGDLKSLYSKSGTAELSIHVKKEHDGNSMVNYFIGMPNMVCN